MIDMLNQQILPALRRAIDDSGGSTIFIISVHLVHSPYSSFFFLSSRPDGEFLPRYIRELEFGIEAIHRTMTAMHSSDDLVQSF